VHVFVVYSSNTTIIIKIHWKSYNFCTLLFNQSNVGYYEWLSLIPEGNRYMAPEGTRPDPVRADSYSIGISFRDLAYHGVDARLEYLQRGLLVVNPTKRVDLCGALAITFCPEPDEYGANPDDVWNCGKPELTNKDKEMIEKYGILFCDDILRRPLASDNDRHIWLETARAAIRRELESWCKARAHVPPPVSPRREVIGEEMFQVMSIRDVTLDEKKRRGAEINAELIKRKKNLADALQRCVVLMARHPSRQLPNAARSTH
jgi:hypothetical protein